MIRNATQFVQRNALRASVAIVAAVPMLASAQSDPFTDAVTASTTKIGAYGAALVGLAVVGVGFMIAIKYVKKIRGAA